MPANADHPADIDVLEAVPRETAALLTQAHRLVAALALRTGLTVPEFRCLVLLCRRGPMTAGELATQATLTDGTVTAIADRLEHHGLARRAPAADGRVLLHADPRARLGPAFRELRETWYPLLRSHDDDLSLVTGLLADGRRLSDLAVVVASQPDAFTL
ncbi:MarR family transcriptional regulator [Sphaerisporangium sp. B11E5]|uniref:MarR family winged helix-turn-helix transcriptional regulator n=1 Tax=Sphaerisporangium sp. B11E5 TaxID=3153563 RepID=UPI00325DECA5